MGRGGVSETGRGGSYTDGDDVAILKGRGGKCTDGERGKLYRWGLEGAVQMGRGGSYTDGEACVPSHKKRNHNHCNVQDLSTFTQSALHSLDVPKSCCTFLCILLMSRFKLMKIC
jgi:hypothetical protein